MRARACVIGAGVASLLGGVVVLGSGGVAGAAGSTTEPYSCVGQPVNVQVAGKATIKNGDIVLKKVVYTFSNNLGFGTVKAKKIQVIVPDPDTTNAPYVANSVKVATTPTGWTAAYAAGTGISANHAASITLANNASFSNAALSAKYADASPGSNTTINFMPGDINITVTVKADNIKNVPVSCTPTEAATPFASVTE